MLKCWAKALQKYATIKYHWAFAQLSVFIFPNQNSFTLYWARYYKDVLSSVHSMHWDQSTQQQSFWRTWFRDRSLLRPEQRPTALEEIAILLSAFSSKTFAVLHPFYLKGVPNLSMPLLTRIDFKILSLLTHYSIVSQ